MGVATHAVEDGQSNGEETREACKLVNLFYPLFTCAESEQKEQEDRQQDQPHRREQILDQPRRRYKFERVPTQPRILRIHERPDDEDNCGKTGSQGGWIDKPKTIR